MFGIRAEVLKGQDEKVTEESPAFQWPAWSIFKGPAGAVQAAPGICTQFNCLFTFHIVM